jgi:predicted permease
MLLVVLVVLAATAVGQVTYAHSDRARALARGTLTVMLYALVPFVAYVNIAHLHITTGVGAGLGLAYLEIATVGTLAWLLGRRVFDLPSPAVGGLICVVILANTAYLGLPLVVTVLGASQLPFGIAFDQLVSSPTLFTAGFGIGAAFGTEAGDSPRQRLRAFITRNPPLLAVVAGLIVPAAAAPSVLVHISHVVALALLPLGFFVLGVNLAYEHGDGRWPLPALDRVTVAAVGLRMLVAPLLLFAFSRATVAIPSAYLLQAAMPSAINSLLVGHAYGLDLRVISAAIGWSTVVAMVVVFIASFV